MQRDEGGNIKGESCPDHIHLLVSIPPDMSVVQLICFIFPPSHSALIMRRGIPDGCRRPSGDAFVIQKPHIRREDYSSAAISETATRVASPLIVIRLFFPFCNTENRRVSMPDKHKYLFCSAALPSMRQSGNAKNRKQDLPQCSASGKNYGIHNRFPFPVLWHSEFDPRCQSILI